MVGDLFGLTRSDMPDTLDDLHDYRREMLEGDTLLVTDWARTRAREIVLEPPVPWVARPLLRDGQLHHHRAAARTIRRAVRLLPAAAGAAAQGAGGGRRGVRQARGDPVPAGAPALRAGRPGRLRPAAAPAP